MIEFLTGTLREKSAVSAVVEVQGIGYQLHISFPTFESLPGLGEQVTLLTHLHVREDAMQLYGFSSPVERTLFRQLQTISGIGARVALNILSGSAPDELRARVISGDVAALTRIPGIGKKTAERIVVELRDTFAKDGGAGGSGVPVEGNARSEALLALQALGYPRPVAEKAVSAAVKTGKTGGEEASELIKIALRELNSR